MSARWLYLPPCLSTAGPVHGAQRMIIGTQLEPPVLDPTANPAAAISEMLYGNVYEGLVQFAADGSVLPKLALSWEISSDGLTYVFHLKSGVRFHDGSDFDAAAAKFSLERILAPGSMNPQRSRLRAIRAVEVHRSSDIEGCCSAAAPADCCSPSRSDRR